MTFYEITDGDLSESTGQSWKPRTPRVLQLKWVYDLVVRRVSTIAYTDVEKSIGMSRQKRKGADTARRRRGWRGCTLLMNECHLQQLHRTNESRSYNN